MSFFDNGKNINQFVIRENGKFVTEDLNQNNPVVIDGYGGAFALANALMETGSKVEILMLVKV